MKLLGLKQVRETFGFTMRELAEKLGVTANTINLWEKGKIDVTDSRLKDIIKFFKVPAEILFTENHTVEDKIYIEIGRCTFKLEEYRKQITDEKQKSQIEDFIAELILENDRMDDFKYTVQKLGEIFSKLDREDYCDFNDELNIILNSVIRKDLNWYKLRILVLALFSPGDKDVGDNYVGELIGRNNREEYMLDQDGGIEDEALLTIREKLEALYIKELYNNGKYIPTWERE